MTQKLDLSNDIKTFQEKNTEIISDYEIIEPKLHIPKDLLIDINELCELFGINRETFIIESIYETLLLYHETPELIFDRIQSSSKFCLLFERIRKKLNHYFGNESIFQRYFPKSNL